MSTVLRRTKSRFFAKDKARDPVTLASVAASTPNRYCAARGRGT